MMRAVWILAAWMVHKHGAGALMAVEARLRAMEREHAEERQILLWCEVARATLEMVREPSRGEAVH
jgi:hypothetical protein